MIEASNIDSGKAIGTMLGMKKTMNFKIDAASRSLPARSEINNQTPWRIKTKNRMRNTEMNVRRNDISMYRSSIFTALG